MDRLDYFLILQGCSGWVDNVDILPGYKSDHSLVCLGINPSGVERVFENLALDYSKIRNLYKGWRN